MQKQIRWILCAVMLSTSMLLTACSDPDNTRNQDKVYLVATDASYAPFESVNSQQEIVGFDVDILKAVAEKAGIKVQFINTPWEGIFNALAAGDRDIVMSCVTITDERKKNMDFSDPYFEATQLIAISENSRISKLSDLRNKKVGVQTATTGDILMQRLFGRDNPNIKRFENMNLALQEMLNGGVDAVVGDNGLINFFIKQNSRAKIKVLADVAMQQEFYGYAVKQGNTELVAKLNKGIQAVKEDGTFDKIYAQYFGNLNEQ